MICLTPTVQAKGITSRWRRSTSLTVAPKYARLVTTALENNLADLCLKARRFRRVVRKVLRAPARAFANWRLSRAVRPPSPTNIETVRFLGNLLLLPYTLYNLPFAPAGVYQLIFGSPLGPEAGYFRTGMYYAWAGTALFLVGVGYCVFKLISRSRVVAGSHFAARHYGAHPQPGIDTSNGGTLAGHFVLMAGCLSIIGLGSYAAQVFPGPLQLLIRSFPDPNQLLPALPTFWNVVKGFLQVGPLTGAGLLTWVAFREFGKSR